MSTINIKNDLRSMFGPVRDQGRRPTCLIFAVSDTHAALREPWQPLSCEYIFYHAQKLGNRLPTQGATLIHVLEALKKEGQPEETGWAYLIATPIDIAQWHPPQGVSPLYRRNSEAHKETVDRILMELNLGRPIVILMTLSMSFYRPINGLVNPDSNEAATPSPRHAVIAVGHGEILGQRVVLVRNSWGAGWGNEGYAWLTEAFLSSRVFELAILKEDLNVHSYSNAA